MNSLSPSPTGSRNSEAYEPVTISQDELQLSPIRYHSVDWLSLGALCLAVKRSMDVAGALVGLLLLAP